MTDIPYVHFSWFSCIREWSSQHSDIFYICTYLNLDRDFNFILYNEIGGEIIVKLHLQIFVIYAFNFISFLIEVQFSILFFVPQKDSQVQRILSKNKKRKERLWVIIAQLGKV